MHLFIVYLGGQTLPGRMGEDHEVVAVVADSVESARNLAKTKWRGVGKAHVDSVQQLDIIDDYRVLLEHAPLVARDAGLHDGSDVAPIDSTYVP